MSVTELTFEERVWAGAYGYLRGLGLPVNTAKSYLAPIMGDREQVVINSVEVAPAHASVAAIEAAMEAGRQYAERNSELESRPVLAEDYPEGSLEGKLLKAAGR